MSPVTNKPCPTCGDDLTVVVFNRHSDKPQRVYRCLNCDTAATTVAGLSKPRARLASIAEPESEPDTSDRFCVGIPHDDARHVFSNARRKR